MELIDLQMQILSYFLALVQLPSETFSVCFARGLLNYMELIDLQMQIPSYHLAMVQLPL
jgi:hypothetical protein